MHYTSPLRYPGGKRKLANFVKLIFHENELFDGEYIEPYAGGASIALKLLYDEYVRHITINDIDVSVYAFWYAVLHETEHLCRLIRDTPVSIDEWHKQKELQNKPDVSLLQRGFSTFYLNRTNRSGILNGGVIGGQRQSGKWLLDARYNKKDLLTRIEKVARYRSRITLHNLDAVQLIQRILPQLTTHTLIYLDPPYYVKGSHDLYTNFYNPTDHAYVAQTIQSVQAHHWIVSYDDVEDIRKLYSNFRHIRYQLRYSAQARYQGEEIIFFCRDLKIPNVTDPVRIKGQTHQRYLL